MYILYSNKVHALFYWMHMNLLKSAAFSGLERSSLQKGELPRISQLATGLNLSVSLQTADAG